MPAQYSFTFSKLAIWLVALTCSNFFLTQPKLSDREIRFEILDRISPNHLNQRINPINYKKVVLSNGITLLLKQDKRVPEVLITVYQSAGAADEWKGMAGVAHLHEHLMFGGDSHFAKISGIAKGVNASTSKDEVIYRETVRADALEHVLRAEADRWINFPQLVTKTLLETQKEVVLNEKRQRSSGLYANFMDFVLQDLFGSRHPYSRPVIGYESDFLSAGKTDMLRWHHYAYDPAKSIVMLNGDIDLKQAEALVRKYFEQIPSTKAKRSVVSKKKFKKGKPSFISLEHNIPGSLAVLASLGAPSFTKEALALEVGCEAFNSGFYKERLLSIEKTTNAGCFTYDFLETSVIIFYLELNDNSKPLVTLENLRKVFKTFEKNSLNPKSFNALKGKFIGQYLRALESKWVQSRYVTMRERKNSKHTIVDTIADLYSLTPSDLSKALKNAARRKTTVLDLQGKPEAQLTDVKQAPKSFAKRQKKSTWMKPIQLPEITDPAFTEDIYNYNPIKFETHRLPNGNKVLYSRISSPFNAAVRIISESTGSSLEKQTERGLASLTISLAKKAGTRSLNYFEVEESINNLGASIGTSLSERNGAIYASVPNHNLQPALHLLSEITYHPSFSEKKFIQEKELISHRLNNAKISRSAINNFFSALMFPKNHTYGGLWQASTSPEFIDSVERKTLVSWHKKTFSQAPLTIILTSSTPYNQLESDLIQAFGEERSRSKPISVKKFSRFKQRNDGVFLFPIESAQQANIIGGIPLAATNLIDDPKQLAYLTLAKGVLGSGFLSRVNLALREDKGWTYGARASIWHSLTTPVLTISSSVDSNHISDAIILIKQLIRDLVTDQPITQEEINRIRRELLFSDMTRSTSPEGVISWINSIKSKQWTQAQNKVYWNTLKTAKVKSVNSFIRKNLSSKAEPLFIISANESVATNNLDTADIPFQILAFDLPLP